MLKRLCRCADHQGPPISAVGSPQPPPIEVRPIEDAKTPPPSHSPIPVPPPAPESPISFSDAENIPPACCANPPAPRAPLQPIDEVVSDAECEDYAIIPLFFLYFALFMQDLLS